MNGKIKNHSGVPLFTIGATASIIIMPSYLKLN